MCVNIAEARVSVHWEYERVCWKQGCLEGSSETRNPATRTKHVLGAISRFSPRSSRFPAIFRECVAFQSNMRFASKCHTAPRNAPKRRGGSDLDRLSPGLAGGRFQLHQQWGTPQVSTWMREHLGRYRHWSCVKWNPALCLGVRVSDGVLPWHTIKSTSDTPTRLHT